MHVHMHADLCMRASKEMHVYIYMHVDIYIYT